MKYDSTNIKTMTIDELTEYIINEMDVNLQLEIVGEQYNYCSFTSLDESKRKDMIVSSLKQIPEDIIESIIKKAKQRLLS